MLYFYLNANDGAKKDMCLPNGKFIRRKNVIRGITAARFLITIVIKVKNLFSTAIPLISSTKSPLGAQMLKLFLKPFLPHLNRLACPIQYLTLGIKFFDERHKQKKKKKKKKRGTGKRVLRGTLAQ